MKVSHLITTFNRAPQLTRTLKRLSMLTKPDELVIMDDGSSDDTKGVADFARQLLGVPVKYIFRDKRNYDVCSIPRNIGIRNCSYEFIVVSEPECLYVTDVIKQFKEVIREYPSDIPTAGVIYYASSATDMSNGVSVNPTHYIENIWHVQKFPLHKEDMYDAHGRELMFSPATVKRAENWTAPVAAFYKKEWLFEVGGWDEDMSLIHGGGGWGFDDTDLLTRLRLRGHGQVIDTQIVVIHQWHDRPPPEVADGWERNEEIMMAKGLCNGVEGPDNPNIVANRGREWGKL